MTKKLLVLILFCFLIHILNTVDIIKSRIPPYSVGTCLDFNSIFGKGALGTIESNNLYNAESAVIVSGTHFKMFFFFTFDELRSMDIHERECQK